ncbi:unnamed protein product [Ectocarpus sp. 6 AP-2014]
MLAGPSPYRLPSGSRRRRRPQSGCRSPGVTCSAGWRLQRGSAGCPARSRRRRRRCDRRRGRCVCPRRWGERYRCWCRRQRCRCYRCRDPHRPVQDSPWLLLCGVATLAAAPAASPGCFGFGCPVLGLSRGFCGGRSSIGARLLRLLRLLLRLLRCCILLVFPMFCTRIVKRKRFVERQYEALYSG